MNANPVFSLQIQDCFFTVHIIYTDYTASIEIEFSFSSPLLFVKGYINIFVSFIVLYSSIFSLTRGCLGRKRQCHLAGDR